MATNKRPSKPYRTKYSAGYMLLPDDGEFSKECLAGQLYTWNGNLQAFIGELDGEQLKGDALWLAEEDFMALTRAA